MNEYNGKRRLSNSVGCKTPIQYEYLPLHELFKQRSMRKTRSFGLSRSILTKARVFTIKFQL